MSSWEPSHTGHLSKQCEIRMKGGKGNSTWSPGGESLGPERLMNEPQSPETRSLGQRERILADLRPCRLVIDH